MTYPGIQRAAFEEWARNNGADLLTRESEEVGEVVEARWSREDRIVWSEEKLEVQANANQMLASGSALREGTASPVLLAIGARTEPDGPVRDREVRVHGEHPDGRIEGEF